MTYRCRACGRRLKFPAFTAPASMGGWMLGPVCAAKATALPGMGDKPKPAPGRKPRRIRTAKMRKAKKRRRHAPILLAPHGQLELHLVFANAQ